MREYTSGDWGFTLVWGIEASVFPRALCVACPNALITFLVATYMAEDSELQDESSTDNALKLLAGFTSVLFFVLYFRSNIAYARWWEGGTLLQKTRGEWFNAYSSLMAFTSLDPTRKEEVEEFQHLLARLMSLLFCCALQQVSPSKDRPFEIIDLAGIDHMSLGFLNEAADKVEVILQWIQRATVIHMASGVLPVAPPVLSRAFQEVSRGIVNLQNARKIADFPFPFPYAQASMVMLLLHWIITPVTCVMMFNTSDWFFSRICAACTAFLVIFFVWCINFIALQLEAPFGDRSNDLPMMQMQRDWNKSLSVLLTKRAQTPPEFLFDPNHRELIMSMSDGTDPNSTRLSYLDSKNGVVVNLKSRKSTFVARSSCASDMTTERNTRIGRTSSNLEQRNPGIAEDEVIGYQRSTTFGDDSQGLFASQGSASPMQVDPKDKEPEFFSSHDTSREFSRSLSSPKLAPVKEVKTTFNLDEPMDDPSAVRHELYQKARQEGSFPSALDLPAACSPADLHEDHARGSPAGRDSYSTVQSRISARSIASSKRVEFKEKLSPLRTRSGLPDQQTGPASGNVQLVTSWEQQMSSVGNRMKELHSCLIDEELRLLASITRQTVPKSASGPLSTAAI